MPNPIKIDMAIIIAHKRLATALTTASFISKKVSPPLEIATRLTVAGNSAQTLN